MRAFNLQGAPSERAFGLANGDGVNVVAGPQGKCLIRVLGARLAGEACASYPEIAAGEAVQVTDECAAASRHLMEITGIAPEGVTGVAIRYSDGSTAAAAIVDHVFKFDGQNPTPGARYPTGILWSDGAGVVGDVGLPVAGDQFCLPAG
jgi:hypothetical protein